MTPYHPETQQIKTDHRAQTHMQLNMFANWQPLQKGETESNRFNCMLLRFRWKNVLWHFEVRDFHIVYRFFALHLFTYVKSIRAYHTKSATAKCFVCCQLKFEFEWHHVHVNSAHCVYKANYYEKFKTRVSPLDRCRQLFLHFCCLFCIISWIFPVANFNLSFFCSRSLSRVTFLPSVV